MRTRTVLMRSALAAAVIGPVSLDTGPTRACTYVGCGQEINWGFCTSPQCFWEPVCYCSQTLDECVPAKTCRFNYRSWNPTPDENKDVYLCSDYCFDYLECTLPGGGVQGCKTSQWNCAETGEEWLPGGWGTKYVEEGICRTIE